MAWQVWHLAVTIELQLTLELWLQTKLQMCIKVCMMHAYNHHICTVQCTGRNTGMELLLELVLCRAGPLLYGPTAGTSPHWWPCDLCWLLVVIAQLSRPHQLWADHLRHLHLLHHSLRQARLYSGNFQTEFYSFYIDRYMLTWMNSYHITYSINIKQNHINHTFQF